MRGAAWSGSRSSAASRCQPSARRLPTTTPTAGIAFPRTWCRAYATTSAPTRTSASTARVLSTRAGPRTGRKFPSGNGDPLPVDSVVTKAEAAGVGEVGESVRLAADTNRVQELARRRVDDIDHAVIAAGRPQL